MIDHECLNRGSITHSPRHTGDTNILLFNALSAANVNTPMISLSIAEFDIAQISSSGVSASGSYASWYVHSCTGTAL